MLLTEQERRSLLDASSYYENGYPWHLWERLRREDPVHYVDRGDDAYWAVTRYEDIVRIEANTEVFKNGPRLNIGSMSEGELRMIVNMDPPEHTAHRALALPYFAPRNVQWVKQYAEEIVTEVLDKAMARNGEVIDLQEDIANLVPTAVISAYLGAPRDMWPRIIDWTNQSINATDPRVAKEEGGREVVVRAMAEMCGVYAGVFADRQNNPQDDLMTALVNARVDDKPLTDLELYSWAIILTVAGHETSQSMFGLGIHLLKQHPDQLAKLKSNPELLPRAIEELLRYASPAIHFVRTPDRDVEVHGKKIRAGEHLVMFYPSANRDPSVFEAPDCLDIERSPNRHLAFGTGPHVCLGQHLARLELRVMFEQFLRRVDLETMEIVGTPERVFTCATGGYRHFPIRMKVSPKQ